jgi:hypothetical protein
MSLPRTKAAGNAGRPGAAPAEVYPDCCKTAMCDSARRLKIAVELIRELHEATEGHDDLTDRTVAFLLAIELDKDPAYITRAYLRVVNGEEVRDAA